MLGNLEIFKKFPAQYVDNGHGTALRKGKAFIFDAAIPGLAAAASAIVRFTTGDSAIVFEGGELNINQEEVLLEVYEDVTFTAPGAVNATLIRNMNRILNTTSELVTYDAPTVDNIGELVIHQIATGTAGQNVNQPGFGAGDQDSSFVLKPNTEHIFKVTNNSVLPVTLEAHYYFHEIEPREYN